MNDSQNPGPPTPPFPSGTPPIPPAAQDYGFPMPSPYGPPPQAPYGAPAPGYGYAAVPPPGAWAPPPKPGLIPLRPLSFGALLGAPFSVLRRNPAPTFGSALIIQLVVAVASVGLVGGVGILALRRVTSALDGDRDAIAAGSVALLVVATLIPIALSLFASALLQGVLVLEVARGTLGEKNRMGTLWRAAARRILPLVAWIATTSGVLLIALAVVVGSGIGVSVATGNNVGWGILTGVIFGLGVAVLATWLGVKTALVPCIIVIERRGMIGAIRRSWALTNSSFWKTFGVLAILAVILYFATLIVSFAVNLITGLLAAFIFPLGERAGEGVGFAITVYGASLVVSLVFGALSAVIQSSAVAVIYIDLRMRKEGLDLELIRFVETRGTHDAGAVSDPYLARGGV